MGADRLWFHRRRLSCVRRVAHSRFLPDTTLRPMVTLKSVCCTSVSVTGWGPSRNRVPTNSPSREGDVAVFVWHNPRELARSLSFGSCVYFCVYGPFNCISFNKFSRQLSAFSLCSSGLTFVVVVLSTIYLFMNISFSPDVIPCGWLGKPSTTYVHTYVPTYVPTYLPN